ncbi:Arm DNA-binding domain-containing protein [Xanthobacter pseudotagetidis]|uniref:Arm DNA-binding domain-containing protein n=1 Tax=Xanthobacter pseudotagetidis TaxID=3119911 RepID=UPI00372D1749
MRRLAPVGIERIRWHDRWHCVVLTNLDANTMSLSDVAVRAAKPKSKPVKLSDSGGLQLLVTPAGGKLWRLAQEQARRLPRTLVEACGGAPGDVASYRKYR